MTLKEIENHCLRLNDLFQRADENGELDPETSAELDRLLLLGDPGEEREQKLQAYLWAISDCDSRIDACNNMISELQGRVRQFQKKKDYLSESIIRNLKLLKDVTGSEKVITKTGIPISINRSGKRPICYDYLEMRLKNGNSVPAELLRKKEIIDLDKEKIRAIMEERYDPDSEESNRKAMNDLGVYFLPPKESLKIGKTREPKS
jgi:hypothetical protein